MSDPRISDEQLAGLLKHKDDGGANWLWPRVLDDLRDCRAALAEAVQASRAPKPRYRVEAAELSYQILDSSNGDLLAYIPLNTPDSEGIAERVCRLLEADKQP